MKNRQRGRNGKQRPPGRNPNFGGGGGGGDQRPRGNAQQLMEKYLSLARDATSAGDRVMAENYFQHADHYYRVLNARFEQQNGGQRRFNEGGQGQNYDRQGNYDQGGYGDQSQGSEQQRQQEHHQSQNESPSAVYQQQHQHQQPQAAVQPEGDIALPPGVLGITPGNPPQAAAESAPAFEANDGNGDGQQQGGRRRRGRGDRSFNGGAGE